MDDLLFRILALAATAGFLLGILSSWWAGIVVGLVIAALFIWLTRKPR